ncbi:hypothetical protein LMH73_017835 [Vibrio splendidus]|nr:hypothetical protein [Vibrio splendidus]MCC4881544.1 hypothetical protein [Vibrio splendidus]
MMIKEPSNKIARFELYKLAKLAGGSATDSRFNAEQIQKSVRQLVTEHDINIFKKEAKIIINQKAIDAIPIINALQIQDSDFFQDLARDVAQNTFEQKPLTRFLELSDTSSSTPIGVSFDVKFPDFQEMRNNVSRFLSGMQTKLGELGIEPGQVSVRSFGFDLDLNSFIQRVNNTEDRWVFADSRELIEFSDQNVANDYLSEFLNSDKSPSEINLGKYVEVNHELETTFDAWMKKAEAPQVQREASLAM